MTEETKKLTPRRVGTLTLGISLVLFGILFLVHMILPAFSYETIFRLWPCMFIILGIEILLSSRKDNVEFRYDKAAVFLVILLTMFAMIMAGADWCMQLEKEYWLSFSCLSSM